MSASSVKKSNTKTALRYFISSVCAAAAAGIYHIFSHGVSSYFMIFMFLFPLLAGTFIYLIQNLIFKGKRWSETGNVLWGCSILTLTLGSFTAGVLEIAGTSSSLTSAFFFAGPVLALAAIIFFFLPGSATGRVETKDIRRG